MFISSTEIQRNYLFSLDSQVIPPYCFQQKEILSAKSFLLHLPLCFKYWFNSDLDSALLSQHYHSQTAFALNFESLKTHLYSARAQYFAQATQGSDKKATCIAVLPALQRRVSYRMDSLHTDQQEESLKWTTRAVTIVRVISIKHSVQNT